MIAVHREPALLVAGLSVSFHERKVVNEIAYEFENGKIYGLIGPNGSGKSSFLRAIAGLQQVDSGALIKCLSADLYHSSVFEWAKRVTYLMGEPAIQFDLSVAEYVALGGYRFQGGVEEARKVLESWGLAEFSERSVMSLSAGEFQRVDLARGVFQDPRVLLLDEALSKIDLDHLPVVAKKLSLFSQTGRMVLWVSHDPHTLSQYTDEVLLMKAGRLVGQVASHEVLKKEVLQKAYPLFV